MNKLAFCDLETNGLLFEVTTVWCAVAYLEDKQKYLIYPSEDCPSMLSWLLTLKMNDYILCFHNGIGFDLQVLKKLFNFNISLDNIVDTLLLSRLYNPDREGHSIEWWGNTLNFHKGVYNDWSKFTPEMLEYCIKDVDVLRRVYYALQEEAGDWDWSESIRLTYRFADVISRQEQHGVLFDVSKASVLLQEIVSEIETTEEKILSEIPKKAVQIGATVTKPFKKNGEISKQVQDWMELL
jgi:DNA polymerase-1